MVFNHYGLYLSLDAYFTYVILHTYYTFIYVNKKRNGWIKSINKYKDEIGYSL